MSVSGELRVFLERMIDEIERIRVEFAVKRGSSGAAMTQLEAVRSKIGERARELGREEPNYPFQDPSRDVRTAVEGMIAAYLRDVLRLFPEVGRLSHRGWEVELALDGTGAWTAVVSCRQGTRLRIEGRHQRYEAAVAEARELIESQSASAP